MLERRRRAVVGGHSKQAGHPATCDSTDLASVRARLARAARITRPRRSAYPGFDLLGAYQVHAADPDAFEADDASRVDPHERALTSVGVGADEDAWPVWKG